MSLRARLTVHARRRLNFTGPIPPPGALPVVTIRVQFFVPLLANPRDERLGPAFGSAVLATAEPFAVFPRTSWEVLAPSNPPPGDRIKWLEPRQVYRAVAGLAAVGRPEDATTELGGNLFRDRYRFEFGRVVARVFDDEGRVMRPVPLIARFLLDESPEIPEPLVGVHAGLLDGRRLIRQPVLDGSADRFREEWWLEDLA